MGETIEALIRRDRWVVTATLILILALAWGWLVMGAGMGMNAIDMTRMVYGDHSAMNPGTAHGPTRALAYWALIFSMWWVMMVAMMLPSAAPVILLAAAIRRKARPDNLPYGPTYLFVLGYLLAWGGFSLLASLAQWGLGQVDLLSDMTMATPNRWLGGGLLIGAAAWQFTPLKQACLKHCRSPVEFLVDHHKSSAFNLGLVHGAWCLGCCWFLMLLLFVGGVMNLVWIAGLSAVVLMEKLLPGGPRVGRWLAGALALCGFALLLGLI